jgi:hypothetical protein
MGDDIAEFDGNLKTIQGAAAIFGKCESVT